MDRVLRAVALAAALAWGGGGALAQSPPPATLTQPGAPGTAPVPQAATRPTLVPEPGDPGNVDEVVLPEKAVIAMSGRSGWTDGLKSIRAAFAKLEAELARVGLAPAGRPLAVFTQTADDDFRFDAMLPVAPLTDPKPALGPEMRFTATISGKAYRFVHKGTYEDIDTTYETITTYLEAKDIVAKDVFMEEFVNDVADPTDVNLEVNIFVQPK